MNRAGWALLLTLSCAGGLSAATLAAALDLPAQKLGRLLVIEDAGTVGVATRQTGGRLTLWPALATRDDEAYAVPAPLLDGLLDRAAEED